MTGPCVPWITSQELRSCKPCEDTEKYTPENLDSAALAASEVLYALSGKQFSGECSDTVRPVRGCHCMGKIDLSYLSYETGEFSALPPQGWPIWPGEGCSCGYESHKISLGAFPLTSITKVKVDGVELDTNAYRIDDSRYLVRIDGGGWPCCQDLLATDDEPNSWSVQFKYGIAPPEMGVRAARALAIELAKSCVGDDTCTLNRRVTNVTRQGISMQLTPGLIDTMKHDLIGIPDVDLFLYTVNPNRLRRRARVLTPSNMGKVHRTN